MDATITPWQSPAGESNQCHDLFFFKGFDWRLTMCISIIKYLYLCLNCRLWPTIILNSHEPSCQFCRDVWTLCGCASTACFQSWCLLAGGGVGRDKSNPVAAHPFKGWEYSPRKPPVQKPPFLSKARGKPFYLCLCQKIEAWRLPEQLLYCIIKNIFKLKECQEGHPCKPWH